MIALSPLLLIQQNNVYAGVEENEIVSFSPIESESIDSSLGSGSVGDDTDTHLTNIENLLFTIIYLIVFLFVYFVFYEIFKSFTLF